MTLKKRILPILAMVLVLTLPACRSRELTDTRKDADLETADRISIMNQGDRIDSEDPDLIDGFVTLLRGLTIKRMPPQPPATGYQYYVDLYCGDTKLMRFVTYGTATRIDIDSTKYTVETPETMEVIIALIEEQYE